MNLYSSISLRVNKLKLKYLYKYKFGKTPNIDNPTTYNEKVQHRKLYDKNNLYVICADKYRVRGYVRSKIGEKYLVPLIDAKEKLQESDFKKYPKSFIIKTNNASGGDSVLVVKDKYVLDWKETIKRINKASGVKYGVLLGEWWYSKIKPMILIENLLLDDKGSLPIEYKLYCFNDNGNFNCIIRIITDRLNGKKSAFYDKEWNKLGITYNESIEPEGIIEKPENLDEIIEVSKMLSEDFDHVRVDLMELHGKLYFGELTFADTAGYIRFEPKDWDYKLGQYWNLKTNEGG